MLEYSTFLWLFQNFLTKGPLILKTHYLYHWVVRTQPLVPQVSSFPQTLHSDLFQKFVDSMSSSSLILFKSFTSLIVVALYANLKGKDLRAFLTSLSFEIFSLRAKNSLAMSHSF